MARLARPALFCVVSVLAALCGGCGSGVHSENELLTITAKSSVVVVGQVSQLHVTANYRSGTILDLTNLASWGSSSPEIASVGKAGVVWCISKGTSLITATSPVTGTSEEVSTSNSITCALPAISITGIPKLNLVGSNAQLEATATYPDGSFVGINSMGLWTSNQPSAVMVDSKGVLVCEAPGTAQITISLPMSGSDISAFASVSATCSIPTITLTGIPKLMLVGVNSELRANASYADGTSADITQNAAWSSSAPSILAIGQHGLMSCKSAGVASVAVAAQGGMASSQVNCSVPRLAISGPGSLPLTGQVRQLSVTASYVDDTISDATGVAVWASSDTSIASISGGRLSCLSDGSSEISAGMNGGKASIFVTCSTPKLTISGITSRNLVGQSISLKATVSFLDQTSEDATTVVHWTVSDPSIVSINSGGTITCNTSGSTQITGYWHVPNTSTNVAGFASIVCSVPDISLSGIPGVFLLGQTKQLHANASYVDGSSSDITGSARWSSSVQKVVGIDQHGVVTCLTVGATQITVSANGSTITSSIVCSSPKLTLSGLTGLNVVGKAIQLHASSSFIDGTSVDVTADSIWTSSVTQTAAVDTHGFATCASAGTTQISASSQIPDSPLLVTASVPLTCTIPFITITGITSIVSVGQSTQLNASALYADGSTANLTNNGNWTAHPTSSAIADVHGVVSCLASGAVQISIAAAGAIATYPLTCTRPSMAISPPTGLNIVGHLIQLHATVTYADGSALDSTDTALWKSANSSVGIVDQHGVVGCLAEGSTDISATWRVTGTTTVVSGSIPISCSVPNIIISRIPSLEVVGQSIQLHATATYSDTTSKDVTALAVWSSSAPVVAAVDNRGLTNCISVGIAQIASSIDGASSSLSVSCSVPNLIISAPAGLRVVGRNWQLQATATYADGTSRDVTTLVGWKADIVAVASVDAAGVITCNQSGTGTITATLSLPGSSLNVTGSFTMNCSSPQLTISGTRLSDIVGQTVQLAASAVFADGTTSDVTQTAIWASAVPTIAAVNLHGAVSCNGVGTTQVSVSFAGAVSTVPVICSVPTITLSGVGSFEVVGQSFQMHASAAYSDGNLDDVTTSTVWTGGTSSVGIGAHGLVTCSAKGVAQIVSTLTLPGTTATVSGTLSVACTVPAISIVGTSTYLFIGTTASLHAVETYADGSTAQISEGLLWSSKNTGVSSIDPNGTLACVGTGTAVVNATLALAGSSASAIGEATVTCSTPTLAISGFSGSVLVGQAQQGTASATTPDGNVLDVTSASVWHSSVLSVAAVGTNGLLTCITGGDTEVAASYGGVSTIVTVTCINKLTSLSISPSSVSMRVGSPVQLTVSGADENGNPFTLPENPKWTSSSVVATVTPLGTISCASAGPVIISTQVASLISSVSVNCSPPSMTTPSFFAEQSDEFVGPFQSWVNVKTTFGAVGDGITDDTAALQRAIDSLEAYGSYADLWLPSGTYKISSSLKVTHKQNFSIIGEDPAMTNLLWSGEANGTMIFFDASTGFRFLRLTLNGNGIADTAVNVTDLGALGGFYATFNEIADLHLLGVNNGVLLSVDAETAIKRVHFDNIAGNCVTTGNFNTLNIFISDSLFDKCGYGVTNLNGAGSFIVTNSFFNQSTMSDMSIYNTGYFSARHNTSVSSKAFFVAFQAGANNGTITLQNNTILDPQDSPFQLGNLGPLMLLDNVVRQQSSSIPALVGNFDLSAPKAVFSIGNTFTPNPGPLTIGGTPFQGSYISEDDSISASALIPDVPIPSEVYHPPNFHRAIFDVVGQDGSAIQNAINQALASGQAHPVVHVPTGNYTVSSTLSFPSGSDFTLVGDDSISTTLAWTGADGPMLMIPTSDVAIKNLRLRSIAPGAADGILLQVTDQTTNQVLADELMAQAGNSISVNFDGVEHLTSELSSAYTLGAITGVKTTAGPFRGAREATLGTTNFYSGSLQSEGQGTSFDVSAAGKFMVLDNWHDGGATSPHNFVLSGGGTVTEQVGFIATNSNLPFEINNFDGDISLIGLQFSGGFQITSGQNHTNLLNLGLVGSDKNYTPVPSGNVQISNIAASYYIGGAGGTGGGHIAQEPLPDLPWLRKMLSQTRSEYPIKRVAMTSGSSRIRLERLQIENVANAIHIQPDSPAAQLFYTVFNGSTELTSSSQTCFSGTTISPVSVDSQWLLQSGQEGDFQIVAASTGWVLGVTASPDVPSSLVMQPMTSAYSQRWMIQNLGDGRFSMTNRGTGELLEAPTSGCIDLVKSGVSQLTSWFIKAN
jgi:hypothetical protein